MRLYRSALHPRQWVACIPGTGWVSFPAREKGWQERRPARGLDPIYLREVSVDMAVNTGILDPEPELQEVGTLYF